MKVDLYTQKGEKSGQIELPKEIFEVEFNGDLIHQALIRQLANQRVAIAHTKTRSYVRGRQKKPFKQKGTGQARQGSTKGPHMRGGAVVFGPLSNRNFSKEMPKKQRRKALFAALSQKARENQVIALEGYETASPKTKDMAALIKKLPIERNVLIVMPEKDLNVAKSIKNLKNAKMIIAGYINIHDLQKYRTLLLFKESVAKLKETFTK
ncbi:50S ribosomal protein L4 [Candidatus Peregrinibacteria bacterium]|nr:50S ribosomal protein L4 [Candidatus Peregrinibacteria bacterium]